MSQAGSFSPKNGALVWIMILSAKPIATADYTISCCKVGRIGISHKQLGHRLDQQLGHMDMGG
jgi:hypothetical protein